MRAASIAAGVFALVATAVSARPAAAFCGFYVGGAGAEMFNHATQVVLVRHGSTTVLSMQNNYQGPPDQFPLVVAGPPREVRARRAGSGRGPRAEPQDVAARAVSEDRHPRCASPRRVLGTRPM